MSNRKQYQLNNYKRDDFEKLLDLVNPTKQDFTSVPGLNPNRFTFVIALTPKEVKAFQYHLLPKHSLTALDKRDYIQ